MAEVILCAVDDSEAAGPVFDTARWLAERLQARLIVVRASDGSSDADNLAAWVRSRSDDERVEVRLLVGSPAQAIQEAADQENPELLVVGSRGHGRLRSAVLGSVSRDLAAQARYPVVVVPPEGTRTAEGSADASVVCGIDGSDEALAGAAFAGRLAAQLDFRLLVVHARQNVRAVLSYPGARSETPPVTGQSDAVEKQAAEVVQRAVEAAGGTAVGVIEPGPPAEVLESVADREGGALIVITARGLGGVRASLIGSVAAELTATAARPVVVLSEATARAAQTSA